MSVYFRKDRDKWIASYRNKSKSFDTEREAILHEEFLKITALAEELAKRKEKERIAAKSAERRAKQRAATPLWADLSKISELYKTSKALKEETGIDHNVDHIVPLCSDIVCGLHCEDNLRVITRDDNLSKSNKQWPDMP